MCHVHTLTEASLVLEMIIDPLCFDRLPALWITHLDLPHWYDVLDFCLFCWFLLFLDFALVLEFDLLCFAQGLFAINNRSVSPSLHLSLYPSLLLTGFRVELWIRRSGLDPQF